MLPHILNVLKYTDIINSLDIITRPDLTSSFSIGFSTLFY